MKEEDDEILGIALTKELCRICAKTFNGSIVMNTKLTKSNAKKIKKMHGKVMSYMKDPCLECQDMMKLGFVLIGVDEKKTTDVTSPYRNGNIYCVKQEVAEEIFKPNPPPKSGVAFIDFNILVQMEFPNVNTNS